MDNFNDFYWHDAIVKSIVIDRKNPGKIDEIRFDILFPDNRKIKKFIFEKVYFSSMSLNFGIIAHETILSAYLLEKDDIDLVNLYSSWKGHLKNIKLNAYVINLNSTGGKIKIIAKNFRLE